MPLEDVHETSTYCRTATGQNQVMVFHHYVATITNAELDRQQLADAMSANIGSLIASLLPTGHSFDGIKMRRIGPGAITPQVVSTAGAVSGGPDNEPGPTQSAPIVTVRSLTAPLRVRGRHYLPSVGEADSGPQGKLEGAYVVAAQAFATAVFVTPMILGGGGNTMELKPIIFSRANLAYFFTTSAVVRQYQGTQRRRSSVNRGDAPLA